MNFKVFFVVLVAVHLSTQSPLKDESIKDLVLRVANQLLNTTGSALKDYTALVDGLTKDPNKVKTDIVNSVLNEGKLLNVDLLGVIDSLKDGATPDGKAVIACLDAEQNSTDLAFSKSVNSIATCLVAEVPVALPEAKIVQGHLTDIQKDAQAQVTKLSTCKDLDLVCVLTFVTNIESTLKKASTTIDADMIEITKVYQKVTADVAKCNLSAAIKKNLQDLFNETVVCLKKK